MKPQSRRIAKYGFSALSLGTVCVSWLIFHGKQRGVDESALEKIILDQDKTLHVRRQIFSQLENELKGAAVLLHQETAVSELEKGRADLIRRAATLEERRQELVREIEKVRLQEEQSKEQHRRNIWAAAEGRKLESFTGKTTGRIYPASVIKSISSLGLLVVDSTGQRSIGPQELPTELREEFQLEQLEYIGCPSVPRSAPGLVKWSAKISEAQKVQQTLRDLAAQTEEVRKLIEVTKRLISNHKDRITTDQSGSGRSRSVTIDLSKLQAKQTLEESRLASLLSQSRKLEDRLQTLKREVASLRTQLEQERSLSGEGDPRPE